MSENNKPNRINTDNLPILTASGLEKYLSVISYRHDCCKEHLEYLREEITDSKLLRRIDSIDHDLTVSYLLYELTLQQLLNNTLLEISDTDLTLNE